MEGWPLALLHGLRLDFTATCYLSAIPALLWMIDYFVTTAVPKNIIRGFLMIIGFMVVLICLVNIMVYRAWGTLFNARALAFAAQPSEMLASLTNVQLLIALLSIALITLFFLFLQRKLFLPIFATKSPSGKSELIVRIAFILIMPIGIRGGLQQIPINESAAYYSTLPVLNHAATNPFWYLLNNVYKTGMQNENPYLFMPASEAEANFSRLIPKTVDSVEIFKNKKPNIVLIVLESWTADIIEPLNGDKGVTPFFTTLADSGLLFTSIYSSGRRTDQMFPSVLSGFPAQPNHSIARFTNKTEKLPTLSNDLKDSGYHTYFFYGGELGFANMHSFLLHGGFENITGKEAFPSENMNSKWGAHDEFVLQYQLNALQKAKAPFFSMVLTLSTHEPFEVPMQEKFIGNDEPSKFRNAAAYTDLCLKNFFTEAKKQEWYPNTLFILVADHGHLLPRKRQYDDPACYHIPLLFYGPALREEYKGKRLDMIGSQHDIAATLLHQLGMKTEKYEFSNDLFANNRNSFAYFNLDEGFGWITKDQQIVYYPMRKELQPEFTQPNPLRDSTALKNGMSYLQFLYQRFLNM